MKIIVIISVRDNSVDDGNLNNLCCLKKFEISFAEDYNDSYIEKEGF